MGFLKDFKDFAMKGSVVDLAVGVIIGGAFGKIVTALVDDVFMPVISMFTGSGELFSNLFIELPFRGSNSHQSLEDAKKAGVNVFAYGHFIQTVVDFLIIALMVFLFARFISGLRKKEEAVAAPPPVSTTEILLEEIRDELRKKQ